MLTLSLAVALAGWIRFRATKRDQTVRGVVSLAAGVGGLLAMLLSLSVGSAGTEWNSLPLLLWLGCMNASAWALMLSPGIWNSDGARRQEASVKDDDAIWAARLSHCEADSIVVVDHHARVKWANQRFEQVHGVQLTEIRGKGIQSILCADSSESSRIDPLVVSISLGHNSDIETTVNASLGGQYVARVQSSPIRDSAGNVLGAVVLLRDVTQQRAMEAELNRRAAEMERLQTAALSAARAKSEFLANMSHEIRTPMTAILGYTELLSEDGDRELAPRSRLEYIDTIKRNGEHLLTIINDILDLSKIESGKLAIETAPTDPAMLVREVMELMQVNAKAKSLRLELVGQGPIPRTIRTDPVRLRQILVNLVGNALKFTELGSVRVAVRCESSSQTGAVMIFEVSDTGIGMSQGQLAELFGAFVQADTSMTRRFGGTGLGLRVSMNLARLLGGTISVRSEPGQGSCFTLSVGTGLLDGVELCCWNEPQGHPQSMQPALVTHTGPDLAGVRVLLAEDGIDNQRLIAFHLRKAGAHVTIFNNGRLALEAMTADGTIHGPLNPEASFDLVVTDMQMPEMDGYTFAAALREKGWTRGIIALTAHAMSNDERKCIQAGCDGYSSKPIERERLIAACAAKVGRWPASTP